MAMTWLRRVWAWLAALVGKKPAPAVSMPAAMAHGPVMAGAPNGPGVITNLKTLSNQFWTLNGLGP